MIGLSPARRTGTPDEFAPLAAPVMGRDGGFITDSDFPIDGGATASYFLGELARRP